MYAIFNYLPPYFLNEAGRTFSRRSGRNEKNFDGFALFWPRTLTLQRLSLEKSRDKTSSP